MSRHPSVRTPVPSRVSWWRELALLAGVYAAYLAIRAQITLDPGAAEAAGRALLRIESWLSLDIERSLNDALHTVPAVAVAADYVYATLHYLLTPAVLVWLAVRHRAAYRSGRNSLLVATAIGLVGFWLLPTAPPRLLEGAGFADTMAVFSEYGWWGGAASAPRGMEGLSNQYAAMPSLHVGWAVWVALMLVAHSRSATVRRWAWTYPALTTLVVMATANHYLLDAVAGALCAVAGVVLPGRPALVTSTASGVRRLVPRRQPLLIRPAGWSRSCGCGQRCARCSTGANSPVETLVRYPRISRRRTRARM
jgi:hypothetical protein